MADLDDPAVQPDVGAKDFSAAFTRPDDLVRLTSDRAGSGRATSARMLEATMQMMPHTQHATITLIRPERRPATLAATGEQPERVDALLHQLGEGPCLLAADDPQIVMSPDLEAETRWPRFAQACVRETTTRSLLSVQLPLATDNRGTFNLYADQAHAFDTADVATATVLATFLALVVSHDLHETDVAHLTTALDTNRQIATAVGVLMGARQLTHEEAFRELQQASNDTNRKVREIADWVVYTGTLPPVDGRRAP